jgi:hypothetical protein
MALKLAAGERTGDVAKRFKVSAGRVSQLRGELAESWRAFVGEGPAAEAVASAVYDATGIRFDEFPLIPQRVLKKLREQSTT